MREFFTENVGLKILSLILAFGLWGMIRAGQQIERNFNVPVELVGLPEDMVVVGDVDPSIALRIRGTRTRLAGLDKKFSRPYTLDMSQAKEGSNTFSIVEEKLDIPYATRVSRISPQIVRVTLEKAEEKTLRVEPNFVGKLPDGFKMKDFEIFPKYVKAIGPRSRIRQMKNLVTEPIQLDDKTESFEGMYSIRTLESGIELEERQVALKVQLDELQVSQIVENIPVLLINAPQGIQIRPNRLTLELRGPNTKVREAMTELSTIPLDLEDQKKALNSGRSLQLNIEPPKFEDVEVKVSPQRVRVKLPKERNIER